MEYAGLPHVLKVLLQCDDALRIDRVVNRDNLSVEEAKKHLQEREEANLKKWERMYGVSDFWDPKHYDLVINTYAHGSQRNPGSGASEVGIQLSMIKQLYAVCLLESDFKDPDENIWEVTK